MTARKQRSKPRRTAHRAPLTGKESRFHFELQLTRGEINQLEDRTAASLRSMSSYVSKVVVDHLRRGKAARGARNRPGRLGRPTDRRGPYHVSVWLAPTYRRRLKARARDDMRSVGNYVTKLVLEHLRRC